MWQERVPSIVMITNVVEGKKTKCEQYWPLSGSLEFGPFKITVTNQQILADYTIGTLSVEVNSTCRGWLLHIYKRIYNYIHNPLSKSICMAFS